MPEIPINFEVGGSQDVAAANRTITELSKAAALAAGSFGDLKKQMAEAQSATRGSMVPTADMASTTADLSRKMAVLNSQIAEVRNSFQNLGREAPNALRSVWEWTNNVVTAWTAYEMVKAAPGAARWAVGAAGSFTAGARAPLAVTGGISRGGAVLGAAALPLAAAYVGYRATRAYVGLLSTWASEEEQLGMASAMTYRSPGYLASTARIAQATGIGPEDWLESWEFQRSQAATLNRTGRPFDPGAWEYEQLWRKKGIDITAPNRDWMLQASAAWTSRMGGARERMEFVQKAYGAERAPMVYAQLATNIPMLYALENQWGAGTTLDEARRGQLQNLTDVRSELANLPRERDLLIQLFLQKTITAIKQSLIPLEKEPSPVDIAATGMGLGAPVQTVWTGIGALKQLTDFRRTSPEQALGLQAGVLGGIAAGGTLGLAGLPAGLVMAAAGAYRAYTATPEPPRPVAGEATDIHWFQSRLGPGPAATTGWKAGPGAEILREWGGTTSGIAFNLQQKQAQFAALMNTVLAKRQANAMVTRQEADELALLPSEIKRLQLMLGYSEQQEKYATAAMRVPWGPRSELEAQLDITGRTGIDLLLAQQARMRETMAPTDLAKYEPLFARQIHETWTRPREIQTIERNYEQQLRLLQARTFPADQEQAEQRAFAIQEAAIRATAAARLPGLQANADLADALKALEAQRQVAAERRVHAQAQSVAMFQLQQLSAAQGAEAYFIANRFVAPGGEQTRQAATFEILRTQAWQQHIATVQSRLVPGQQAAQDYLATIANLSRQERQAGFDREQQIASLRWQTEQQAWMGPQQIQIAQILSRVVRGGERAAIEQVFGIREAGIQRQFGDSGVQGAQRALALGQLGTEKELAILGAETSERNRAMQERIQMLQAESTIRSHIYSLTVGPGGEVQAARKGYEEQLRLIREIADVTEDRVSVEANNRLAGLQYYAQLRTIEAQRQQETRQIAGGVFDAMIASGTAGIEQFGKGLMLTYAKRIFMNTAAESSRALGGLNLGSLIPGQEVAEGPNAGQLTWLGRVLQGTPVGVNQVRKALQESGVSQLVNRADPGLPLNTSATDRNTAALQRLTDAILRGRSGASGGMATPAPIGAFAPGGVSTLSSVYAGWLGGGGGGSAPARLAEQVTSTIRYAGETGGPTEAVTSTLQYAGEPGAMLPMSILERSGFGVEGMGGPSMTLAQAKVESLAAAGGTDTSSTLDLSPYFSEMGAAPGATKQPSKTMSYVRYGATGIAATLGVVSGIRQGGVKGGLSAAASGLAFAAQFAGPQQPFIAAAALGAWVGSMLVPDARKARAKYFQEVQERTRYEWPEPYTEDRDLSGVAMDYNFRGQPRTYRPTFNVNVNALDAKSIIDNSDKLADAIQVAVARRHPLLPAIQNQLAIQ